MVPVVGLEPTLDELKARCSAIELYGHGAVERNRTPNLLFTKQLLSSVELRRLEPLRGLKPPTPWVEARCSNSLSYRGIWP